MRISDWSSDVCSSDLLEAIAAATFEGMDAWVTPSTPFTALPVESLQYPEEAKRALLSSRNTQPANVFGLCAASLPIQQFGSTLPVGLQLRSEEHTSELQSLLRISYAVFCLQKKAER